MNVQIFFQVPCFETSLGMRDQVLHPYTTTDGYHHTRRPHTGARLRHLRHLVDKSGSYGTFGGYEVDASEPHPRTTILTNTEKRLTVQDNHKPVFTNCSQYAPTVKEEEPSGTYVFTVKAVDKDPPEAGGSITYTFVSAPGERLKFSIDQETGVIKTRHMFDRDEPSREKEVYLTVRATDNGRPQLDDACTIKVIIEDINDNSPVFDKVIYRESVPQDLQLDREVMRISATDIDDGNNSIVLYKLEPKQETDQGFLRIDSNTGVIFLNQTITRMPGYVFRMRATATDQGAEHNVGDIDLEILVVDSQKKAPSFTQGGGMTVQLKENYNDFSVPIATLTAESNIPDESDLQFELVPGRTEQTNLQKTFILETSGPKAMVKLGRLLDYESISEYTLTIRVQNKYSLAATTTIYIQVEDVNDNIPAFTEVVRGSVLENEPPGTPVMQIRAIDADGTEANNQVTYALADHTDLFHIDPKTGNITTLKTFDREEKDFYNVKLYATDNSPSSLYTDGSHNTGQQVFRIEIADKNDNPPRFTQEVYVAEAIPEDANINYIVTEVKAQDNDTASTVRYSIVGGNTYDAFLIEDLTGKIRVNSKLDYENITSYTLLVKADDGIVHDMAKVEIKIENVNDNPPVFLPYNKNITIQEEEIVPGCIVTLQAYDPDIQVRTAEQHIEYFVVKEDQQMLLHIAKNGCLSQIKPLDRDLPNGFSKWQVLIAANDEDGGPTSLRNNTEVIITLTDINDNAPFLDMVQPVKWDENQMPGIITQLNARDYDSEQNGPPFIFTIADSAPPDIIEKFAISGDHDLEARVTFDREHQKKYMIPIAISDSGSPTMTGTSTLIVEIGDVNDNAMKEGHSSIFMYNYKGEAPNTEIGRVYVEDPDDWDLGDKHFMWKDGIQHQNFDLDRNTGMITMLQGTSNNSFLLKFTVTEEAPLIPRHSVDATVNVTVKEIPEEAVDKSGSVRMVGVTAEEFIKPQTSGGPSKHELFHSRLARILNVSLENVDVFTVLHSPHNSNASLLDVRFSVHGSPYRRPEKLNAAVGLNKALIEQELGVTLLMINIDECLIEKASCETSCTNFLTKSNVPSAVYTNTTSFVGVRAVVDPMCTCSVPEPLVCLNGGTPIGTMCECMEGYEGPHCEIIGVGFYGSGWALYPTIAACDEARLTLELAPHREDGLVFYVGPMVPNPSLDVRDFMSLEIERGYARLLVDYGTGTVMVEQRQIRLTDGKSHRVDILWSKTSIELKVDNCQMSSCLSLTTPQGPNEFLNVNGPLQLGGTIVNLNDVANGMNWTHRPTSLNFAGCIRNLTVNDKTYNLGEPSDSKDVDPGCSRGVARAVSFGINTNFLVAILVCIAILLILLLAVVVHRRKTDDLYKDTDDIRENIINYEDEGGGEGDMTGYDLNVLRLLYDDGGQPMLGKEPLKAPLVGRGAPDEVPDICGFLDGKKKVCDNDPETNPFDDVRHYAYEGDGNTTGSLSSLASGTDEGDLNFDYLSNFGPRFRKLADMYGEDPSDEDDENFNTPASESWC
ncbi:DE-cadherin isoform X2 [Zootermopsis nevadensis]|uniref:DE-cadherin isoform X2 n=2 Tax=Zootermopsis nevadensis TaxID=136037 RepID=UPI000B8EA702|nr:DE-cadherin isoform X2 [Zootermopsis nevadensis]